MHENQLTTILWRGKYLILLSLAVAVALAVVATKMSSKVYEASAVLQVNATPGGTSGADALATQQASQGLASTYATRIVDRGFLAQIQPRVESGRLTTGDLQARLSATAVPQTTLVELKATGPTPLAARELAREVGDAFVATVRDEATTRTRNLQTEIDRQIDDLNARIQQLSRGNGETTHAEQLTALRGARTALVSQQQGLLANGLQQSALVSLTAPPTGSSAPIKPRPMLNYLAGVLLGLLAGAGLAWLRARLDRGLHDAAEAEELLGVPLLAPIPLRRRHSADDAVLGEAHDVLRANLAFLSLDRPLEVLTFSSYSPGEGKTSTVDGLAHAAVRGGIDVLMVDADVRTRSLSQRLGYADVPGLTTVVADLTTLEDAIVELAPGLSFLPAGPTPPNPPSLLSSTRMTQVVAQMRDRHALVLIDSPPVANLADASILASVSDGVVVVARVGITQRADLPAAAAKLRHSPTPIVGAVVLEPREVDQTYYPAMAKGSRGALPDAVSP